MRYLPHFKKKGKPIVPLTYTTYNKNPEFMDLVRMIQGLGAVSEASGLRRSARQKHGVYALCTHIHVRILSCLELAHHVPPSSSSPTSHPQVQTALFIGLGALSGYIALKMVFYCWLGTVERF